MNKLISDQLKQVKIADLTNFNSETNTYVIPKIKSIKVKENISYLIRLKDVFFQNETLKLNWNNGIMPKQQYLKADVLKVMNDMIKVMSVEYDAVNQVNTAYWNGWLPLSEIEIIQQL